MTRTAGSPLSRAEREQRARAALTHGAYAKGANGTRAKGGTGVTVDLRWHRLRKSLNSRGVNVGDIAPKAYMELQLLTKLLVLIERTASWLDAQADPVFTASGATHGVLERYTGWIAQAAAIVARLPEDLAESAETGLGGLLANRRR